MCIGTRLFGKRKARKVLLRYPPKLVSIASILALKPPLFKAFRKILRGLRIRAKSKLLQKGHEEREQMRDASRLFLFSFFPFFPSPYSFLVRLIFEIRVYPRKTRVYALRFLLPGKLHFEKSIFYPSLFLARARVAHDEYLCSYARIRARTGDELPLLPIVYDLFHDKGIIAAMEGIVAMVNFVTCALAHIPFFGFISTIPSRREVVSED